MARPGHRDGRGGRPAHSPLMSSSPSTTRPSRCCRAPSMGQRSSCRCAASHPPKALNHRIRAPHERALRTRLPPLRAKYNDELGGASMDSSSRVFQQRVGEDVLAVAAPSADFLLLPTVRLQACTDRLFVQMAKGKDCS